MFATLAGVIGPEGTAQPGPALTRVPRHAAPRSQLHVLRRLLRNPMEGWPAAIYREGLVRRRLLGRIDTAFVTDPDLIKLILLDRVAEFRRSTTLPRGGLKPVLREGLLTTEGAEWRWQRRTTAPLFRRDRLDGFVPAMQAAAERSAARLTAAGPRETDIAPEMMRTTFEIILQTMLSGGAGIDPHRVEGAVGDLLGSVNWGGLMAILGAPEWVPYPGKARTEASRLLLRRMVADAVAARRPGAAAAETSGDSSGEGDLLARLAQAIDPDSGAAMPQDQVIDNILTFILAGHETTALALTWSLYILAHYPDAVARIRAETASATAGGPVTAANLEALEFTRRVVMESLRLYPPAAAISRIAREDMTLPTQRGEERIARNTFLIIPIYALHRHEALWPAGDAFDPDHFLPERVAARHRYAYLPFAAGPHTCIGMHFAIMEATVILANLLRGLDFTLRPGFDPGMRLRITLRPARGMMMRVTPA